MLNAVPSLRRRCVCARTAATLCSTRRRRARRRRSGLQHVATDRGAAARRARIRGHRAAAAAAARLLCAQRRLSARDQRLETPQQCRAMRNPHFDDSPELQACRQKFRLLELERSRRFAAAKRFSRRRAPYLIITAGAAGCSARIASATAASRSIWDPRSDGYTCTCTTRRFYWPSTRRK